MRITIDLTEAAYKLANAAAREQKRSLGSFISEIIEAKPVLSVSVVDAPNTEFEFPTFRCVRQVTAADTESLHDEY